MIEDKVLSSTSAQDSDSWEPIEFDTNTNESLESANISVPGPSSAKKLEDLDTKITLLEEKLAQQNNKTVTQMERLVNEVISLKDIVSSQQKKTHRHFNDLKDKARLDRSEIIHNVKEVKKDIQTLDEKRSEVLEDLEDLLDEARSSFHTFKTEAEVLSMILNNRNIFSSLIKSVRDRRPHDFGPLQQGWSHGCHGRVCSRCGIVQLYGRKYGSKRNPGYEQIDETCIPSSVNVLPDPTNRI
ncbi:predicted protein [Chaetoceros tenuissimus]|uniref:Uncharacterized protein n=1 Tax=Chaetoceros tenuissimus TaxID=426638 RepID=A0AAD3CK55_9STRA|nr:predicted protein [Chaetoceros tenuissimus]